MGMYDSNPESKAETKEEKKSLYMCESQVHHKGLRKQSKQITLNTPKVSRNIMGERIVYSYENHSTCGFKMHPNMNRNQISTSTSHITILSHSNLIVSIFTLPN